MTLIKSISGIRGTIGGKTGDNLTPIDAVKFAAAYGTWLKSYSGKEKLTVVIGRDARISGPMIHNLVINTLVGLGIDVIDLGLSTTPTVEIAVPLALLLGLRLLAPERFAGLARPASAAVGRALPSLAQPTTRSSLGSELSTS